MGLNLLPHHPQPEVTQLDHRTRRERRPIPVDPCPNDPVSHPQTNEIILWLKEDF